LKNEQRALNPESVDNIDIYIVLEKRSFKKIEEPFDKLRINSGAKGEKRMLNG